MGIPLNFKNVSDEDVGKFPDAFTIKDTLCVVINPEEKESSKGDAYLKITLVVADGGEHDGEVAGSDNLHFHTEKVLQRSMFVLRRLGQPVDAGEFVLEAERLSGAKVLVTTELERSCPESGCFGNVQSAKIDGDGNTIYACKKCVWRGVDPFTRAKPTYAGYEMAPDDAAPSETGKVLDDIPF